MPSVGKKRGKEMKLLLPGRVNRHLGRDAASLANVQQAARGTQQVSANISDVQRGAGETGTASSQVLSSAQSLSSDSNRLKREVGKFLNSVRAA